MRNRIIYFAGNDDGKSYNTRIIHSLLSYFFDIYKQKLFNNEEVDIDSIEYLGNLIDLDLDAFSKRPGVSLQMIQRVKYIKENLIIKYYMLKINHDIYLYEYFFAFRIILNILFLL